MKITEEQIQDAMEAVREKIDATGYGGYVSDEMCRDLAKAALEGAFPQDK